MVPYFTVYAVENITNKYMVSIKVAIIYLYKNINKILIIITKYRVYIEVFNN